MKYIIKCMNAVLYTKWNNRNGRNSYIHSKGKPLATSILIDPWFSDAKFL